jgi:hypothetical protein
MYSDRPYHGKQDKEKEKEEQEKEATHPAVCAY